MNTHPPRVRLTERSRTLLEMRAAGYYAQDIMRELNLTLDEVGAQIARAEEELGAKSEEHAIALAIRGGHIL